MCKHVAAVLYGVGARLDHKPELLFRLRAVDETDLVARIELSRPLAEKGSDKVLKVDDMSALFGLDMVETTEVNLLLEESRFVKKQSATKGTAKEAPAARASNAAQARPAVVPKKTITEKRTRAATAPKQIKTAGNQASIKAAVSKQATAFRKNAETIVAPSWTGALKQETAAKRKQTSPKKKMTIRFAK